MGASGVEADRDRWFLAFPIAETPRELLRAPGTLGIIVVSLLVVGLGGPIPQLTRALECTTTALADGELWRLVTYVLPHEGGWIHVLINMSVLALFGWQLERRVSTSRFLVVYFGSGAIGMALLFARNPIDEAHGLRSGASLAVFGAVAALAAWHVIDGGIRSPAVPWAVGTCVVLLLGSGLLNLDGHPGVIDPGLQGFLFGIVNHALGMVAGVIVWCALDGRLRSTLRVTAATIAVGLVPVALVIGTARWT